jgi:DNA-binding NarL/FixJ family response regulator
MRNESPVTVFIADSDLLFCESLQEVFKNRGLQVVSFATDKDEAIRLIKRYEPQIAILTCSRSKMNGINVLQELKNLPLDTSYIIISDDEETVQSVYLSKVPVQGHLMRGFGIGELYYCIQELVSQRMYSSAMVHRLIDDIQQEETDSISLCFDMLHTLTKREVEILKALSYSYTTPKIAETLYISSATVNNHRAKIMEKLKIRGRNQLLSFAISARTLL